MNSRKSHPKGYRLAPARHLSEIIADEIGCPVCGASIGEACHYNAVPEGVDTSRGPLMHAGRVRAWRELVKAMSR